MNLKKVENASVIHIRQFRQWRNTGVAFEFGDQVYEAPNRSMAAYTEARKKQHGSVLCRGLWTDIVVGPYVSFGVDCDRTNKFAEQLFEIHNKGTGVEQNRHNTTEVAVYNVLSSLYEIETGVKYEMRKAHDVYSGIGESELEKADAKCCEQPNPEHQHGEEKLTTIEEIVDDVDESDTQTESDTLRQKARERDAKARALTIVESLEGVKIVLVTGTLGDLYTKKRYERLFDHVFLSSPHSHTLQEVPSDANPTAFSNLLRDTASVSIESSTFLLPLTEDQRVAYVEKLLEMAKSHGLQPTDGIREKPRAEDLQKIKNAVLPFRFCRTEE
ncbi:hypothetical protein PINS_up004729 [Pythium insidiosum]|nr:hypothetical protein PINS_up004729 [Pythium insidiosum]